MQKLQDMPYFYSSVVIEHIVPKGRDYAFRRWYRSFVKTAKQHDGFLRADDCPPLPCYDDAVKWYSIIHFDTPEHLNAWIESDDRQAVMKLGQDIFQGYWFKSFTTGLEGWFASHARNEQNKLGPPAWKQILSVVLGLYPIIMIQSWLFRELGVMQHWAPAPAMLINNLITSTILTLVVMPFVANLFNFWLRPAYRKVTLETNLIGLGIVLAAMVVMVLLFNHF
jgi:hypothetical protein